MILGTPLEKFFKRPLAFVRANEKRMQVRFLNPGDIDSLLELETKKWEPGQAAGAQDMLERMQKNPQLSLGVFDPHTGQALASLFLKPTSLECLMQSASWSECVSASSEVRGGQKALFGISFSSIKPQAADALFEFFWPHALKTGWRHIYLGSPVPGFTKWLAKQPKGSIYRYVHGGRCLNFSKRQLLPRDPQLRYYAQRGFRHIVYIRPNYFPHEASQNFGVLLRGTVPLSWLSWLWRCLPLHWVNALQNVLFHIL